MTRAAPPTAAGRIHRAWIVAGVVFVTLLAAAGFRSVPAVLLPL